LSATVQEYQLHEQTHSKIENVGNDIIMEHADNEFSYFTNSFNSEMLVVKKEDGSFDVSNLKYFVIPAALGFTYVYQVYFKAKK